MDNRETILRFIQTNGPILPAKIAKLLNTEILLASAQLSELVDNKKLRISNTKVGGSPLYYLEGQERRLQEFTDNLNEKDRQAVTLLKEKKVTKDQDLEPLMRVSMRAIKDFAVPLQVTYNNQKQLFWKYYLVDGDEAQEIIKSYLQPNGISKKVESKESLLKEERPSEQSNPLGSKPNIEKIKKENQIEPKNQDEEKLKEERRKINEEKSRLDKQEKKLEERQKEIEKIKIKLEEKRKQEETILEEAKRSLEEEKLRLVKAQEAERKRLVLEEQQKFMEEEKVQDPFMEQIRPFFEKIEIKIKKIEIIKKKSEIDFFLKIPSAVGDLEYYCKAKSKKKITEIDLNAVFVQGQLKKLPVLFLITGDLTKKAQELLTTELNKGIIVRKI